jgi:hypothetical protein
MQPHSHDHCHAASTLGLGVGPKQRRGGAQVEMVEMDGQEKRDAGEGS